MSKKNIRTFLLLDSVTKIPNREGGADKFGTNQFISAWTKCSQFCHKMQKGEGADNFAPINGILPQQWEASRMSKNISITKQPFPNLSKSDIFCCSDDFLFLIEAKLF